MQADAGGKETTFCILMMVMYPQIRCWKPVEKDFWSTKVWYGVTTL